MGEIRRGRADQPAGEGVVRRREAAGEPGVVPRARGRLDQDLLDKGPERPARPRPWTRFCCRRVIMSPLATYRSVPS